MAWGEEEEDEDGTGAVAQALADPSGTYANENGAAPEQTPTIQDGSPSTQDANRADDQEATSLAQPSQPPFQDNSAPVSSEEIPEYLATDNGQQQAQTTPEQAPAQIDNGDPGDSDTAALAGGTQTFTAPKPLQYQPYADHSADQQALVTQKAGENPANYKPSVGRRILAGIAGGLVGAGTHNGGEGMAVGRSVTGAPLERAQRTWAAQEAPLQQKLEADKAADQAVDRTNQQATNTYNAAERNMTNQAKVADWNAQADQRKAMAQAKLNTVDKNTLGPVDPNNPFGEWQGKTPGGQVVRGLEPPPAIQKDPRFQRQQRFQAISDMQKNGIRLNPQEQKYYVSNGKLAEPTTHVSISNPNEETERYNDWKAQFKQQNGRAPNADETYAYHFKENPAGSDIKPNLAKTIKDSKDKAFNTAQQEFAAADKSTPDKAESARQDYEQSLQDAQDKFEGDISNQTHDAAGHTTVKVDANGTPVFQDEQGNTLPAQGAAQSAAPQRTAQPDQVVSTRQVPGGTDTKMISRPPQQAPAAAQPVIKSGGGQQLTDKNLAAQYLQKAGGDKNKARQLAQKDNWKF